MDDIHEEFALLCQALANTTKEMRLQKLAELLAHTVEHFEKENQWMIEYDFPMQSCHRREHEEVLSVIQEVQKQCGLGDDELALNLAKELPNWLEHHVQTMDKMLGQFLVENMVVQE
jgi:hemerythrin